MEEKKPHAAAASLARSLALSPPLRTDRSFDSGSKFTLQTCWEAAELRREGLSALQGPRASAGSPVRNTKAGNKLDSGAAVRGAPRPRAPGEGCGGRVSGREVAGLAFRASNCSNSRNSSARHTYSQIWKLFCHVSFHQRLVAVKDSSEMYHLKIRLRMSVFPQPRRFPSLKRQPALK